MGRNASGSHRVQAFVGALAAWLLALVSPAWAASQGPVADGPYLGTLPCADCAGIRTELTLFTTGPQGQPDVYRMRTTHLGTREAARTEERMGPWLRMHDGGGDRVRLEPYDDALRQTLAGPSAGPASGPADRPQILLPARHRGFRGMPR